MRINIDIHEFDLIKSIIHFLCAVRTQTHFYLKETFVRYEAN